MASILVTGGAGFIGSNLCKSLLSQGHSVHCVDNLITGRRVNIEPFVENENFSFYECDTANPALLSLFSTHFDYVYHLACPTGVPNLTLLATEMLHACSYGTFNVLELAKKHEAKILLTSTAEIYGQPEKSPQDEAYSGNVHPMGIRSAYEEGKRFAEACVATYVRYHGLDARVVRVFNTYGPGMSLNDHRVIPQFISNIKKNQPVRVYGDGSQTRTHLFVDDLVRGLEIVMRSGEAGQAYNIGGSHALTIRELAELLIALTNHKAGIVFEPHFIEDHTHRLPHVGKVSALGWKQEVTIAEGLQCMIDLHLAPHGANVAPNKRQTADDVRPRKLAVA